VVLAIKPQMLDAAAPALARLFGADSLLISILAGKTMANLGARLPARAIVRAMPNTPASIGRGITGAFASEATSPAQRAQADFLLGGVGAVEWVDSESLIDAVTAISGSGPAYVFHLVEALAQAGAALGLPDDLALRLARATVEGSGELLHLSPEITAEILRKNVTSPGGTTQAALDVLMAPEGLAALMARATAAAARRAGELSG
jgi:pyrroline-5-carboxylate reductase